MNRSKALRLRYEEAEEMADRSNKELNEIIEKHIEA